ncbi:murein L,D-transpeptidase family protein [Pedobacter aquatilis]|uniref:L,D-transpeptidase family protein n=1 Tax=Pedobacter aquatilis TaxID=351343 RepID=UPI00293189D4|nr:L,D-transpeptidase family protein [Pedobacter aquatilis]
MRYLSLIPLLAIILLIVFWKRDTKVAAVKEHTGILWNDSLFKSIPAYLDTSIIVFDANETPLKFNQYIKPLFNNEALIYADRGKWRLQRLTKGGLDSLSRDDQSSGRSERWINIRNPDTSASPAERIKKIANTLSMADYILVFKSKRKMFVKRKGINVLEFDINLGGNPIGDKEYEGDRKTPEGIYHLDMKFERNDKFYKSIWISYPDSADKANALKKGLKPGSGVLIHGTSPERVKSKDWTNGCIALKNYEMDSLFNHVMAGTTIEIRK